MEELLQQIYDRHDIHCNQKYDGTLPYSFHLKLVVTAVKRFCPHTPGLLRSTLILAGGGHDLIEDARMSPNDVKDLLGEVAAKIIYACSDEKGWTRGDRHSDKFFDELIVDRDAVFIKLCDVYVNASYGLLSNSAMYKKYQQEFLKLRGILFIKGEYDKLWEALEHILKF